MNSGATPTPRRAERPGRLRRDGWQGAGGSARRDGRARGPAAGAHHAPERPGRKERRRALPRVASGKDHAPTLHRVQSVREGGAAPGSRHGGYKGSCRRRGWSFYVGELENLLFVGEFAAWTDGPAK